MNPTGQAAKTNLCVGDRILRVNEEDMQTATHHQAVSALISNDPEVKLLVRHDPPPPGIQEININKKLGEKLGISIRGGAKGHPGNPFDKEDEGIFVSKVISFARMFNIASTHTALLYSYLLIIERKLFEYRIFSII